MRLEDAHQGVSDALQADVMRFMAIIAFCLIAILALVRSVEPTPGPAGPAVAAAAAPTASAVAEPQVVPVEPPLAPQPALPAEPAKVATEPAVAAAQRAVATELAEPPVAPPESPPRAAIRQPAARQPSPDPAGSAVTTAAAASAQSESARQGLSLRFASERDFLRLVNRGDIRLFAFREGEVLAVSGDFRLQPATTPGALHELLPETIPALMLAALNDRRGAAAWRWGIAMPVRMAAQVRSFVERGVSGELIIDGRGEVHHDEA